ncbi:chromate efflux transporter [Haladaptatus caseinilyticus]|uniref:chromate efflux transporter n=1 Tax=Haladaptatus caseinilyticus TaxID=2993314 RepID=UPI00224AE845|nr:chromate efflux transporter [Haladaptatus caseinilyticus]
MADETVNPERHYKGHPSPANLREIAGFFLKIGVVGFGGPLVHIAMMEDELVGEGSRQWTDESTFMEGLAICNMLPGPASTQLGIFMGWVRGGTPGAVVAGACFMLPAFAIIVALSYLYFAYGELPAIRDGLLYAINPVVIGLIVGSAYSMARSALGAAETDLSFEIGDDSWSVDVRLLFLLVAALVATILFNPNPVLEFAVAGFVALLIYRWSWVASNLGRMSLTAAISITLAGLYFSRDKIVEFASSRAKGTGWYAAVASIAGALWANTWVKLVLFMLYTGSFIYGGGLVLIPFIEKYVVDEFGWMDTATFVDGIALGQLTPGPVVMTTAFVGYELFLSQGIPMAVFGAFVAAFAAFAPSFVFIVAMFPYVARVRDNPQIRTALVGINAAVVGAILGATVSLAQEAIVDPLTTMVAFGTFVLFVRGVKAVTLILGGGVIGIVAYYLL